MGYELDSMNPANYFIANSEQFVPFYRKIFSGIENGNVVKMVKNIWSK